MKKIVVIIFVLCFVGANAQSEGCNLPNNFDELYRYQKAEEAHEIWAQYEKNCANKTFVEYKKGEQVYQYEYDNADAETKSLKREQLLKYYDSFQALFPEENTNLLVKKAMLMAQDKEMSDEKLFQILSEALNKRKETFQDPMALKLYFDLVVKITAVEESKVKINPTIEYLRVKVKAKQNQLKYPNQAQDFENLIQYLNTSNLGKESLNCETLEKYARQEINAKSKDVDFFLMLTSEYYEKCRRDNFFPELALYTHEIKKSAQSFYYLGVAKLLFESPESAEFYLTSSIELEEDAAVKAQRASDLAGVYLGFNPSKAAEFLNLAIQIDPKNPDNYFLMAEIYEASIPYCSFEGKQVDAVHYLASQVVLESAKVDPKYTVAAQKKSTALKLKMKTPVAKGKKNTVQLGCWINKSVTW